MGMGFNMRSTTLPETKRIKPSGSHARVPNHSNPKKARPSIESNAVSASSQATHFRILPAFKHPRPTPDDSVDCGLPDTARALVIPVHGPNQAIAVSRAPFSTSVRPFAPGQGAGAYRRRPKAWPGWKTQAALARQRPFGVHRVTEGLGKRRSDPPGR